MNEHVTLCREKIAITGPATLGIHSNVAGDSFEYSAGHAWITVSTPRKIYFLGFWPDGHPRVANKSPYCTDVRIGMEAKAQPLASRYYELRPDQIIKLNAIINKPDAWRYENNCTSWAVRVIKEVVGININATDHLLFSTPRELGAQLLKFEQKQPSAPLNPVRGAPAEAQKGFSK